MSRNRLFLAAILACAAAAIATGSVPAQPAPDGAFRIVWEVKNRFRLFRREADFQRHVIANRAGNQLAAEHLLQRDPAGRGWAQNQVEHLCVDAAGLLLDTCDRDGERENYLAPKTHPWKRPSLLPIHLFKDASRSASSISTGRAPRRSGDWIGGIRFSASDGCDPGPWRPPKSRTPR